MMQFRSLVKAHWDKYLPEMVKEMKAEGTYEKLLNSEAQRMSEELAQMVRGGAQIAAAMEIIRKEYLYIPSETTDE